MFMSTTAKHPTIWPGTHTVTKNTRRFLAVPVALLTVAAFGCSTEASDSEAKTATTVGDEQTAAAAPAPTTTTVPPATTTTAPENPVLDNAIRSAESYKTFNFSRQGLIDQLSSEFGDQYPVDVATQAVDSLGIDWMAEAVEAARDYLLYSGYSHAGLVDQLSSEYGDQFTPEEAEHGATVALGGL